MRHIVVLAEAEEDLELGTDFYDRRELGLGDYFFDALISDIILDLRKRPSWIRREIKRRGNR